MEIIELNLKHFGRFTDYRLKLHAGVNIISGANETGKSTLHAFIRAMLYGISRSRSRSLDEYQLREPWENPGYFAGSMKLLYEGKIYRIDRNFHKKDESVSVVCETDGTEATDPEAAIRYFTGGLSGEDFDNTVYIRQAQPAAGTQLGARLRDYLVNTGQSGDEALDVSASLDYLKKKRKKLENEKNAALSEIDGRIREKTNEAEYVNRDLERLLERRLNDAEAQRTGAAFERVEEAPGDGNDSGVPDKEDDRAAGTGAAQDNEGDDAKSVNAAEEETDYDPDEKPDTSGVMLPALVFLSFAAAGLMCACAFLSGDMRIRVLTGAGAVLTGITAFLLLWRILHPVSRSERLMRKMRREAFLDRTLGFREDPADPDDRAMALRRQQKAQDAILRAQEQEEMKAEQKEAKRREIIEKELEKNETEDNERRGREVARIVRSQVLDREISLRREKLDDLRSALEELYRKKAALSAYDDEIRAVVLAAERIRELSGSIYHESGGKFTAQVSALLSHLTKGRYTRISLDEKMLVRLNTPDRLLGLEQVSFGTMQQVYLALRLASADILSDDQHVPVILDEPFSMYDDERLRCALQFLSTCPRQVILFTCQSRELDILSSLSVR